MVGVPVGGLLSIRMNALLVLINPAISCTTSLIVQLPSLTLLLFQTDSVPFETETVPMAIIISPMNTLYVSKNLSVAVPDIFISPFPMAGSTRICATGGKESTIIPSDTPIPDDNPTPFIATTSHTYRLPSIPEYSIVVVAEEYSMDLTNLLSS